MRTALNTVFIPRRRRLIFSLRYVCITVAEAGDQFFVIFSHNLLYKNICGCSLSLCFC